MTRPEALRLAEWAEWFCRNVSDPEDFRWQHMAAAAAELRRLHAENEELWKEREEPHKTIEMYVRECNRLESERDALKAQRDALLEACRFYAFMMGRRKSNGEPFYMTALDLDCGDRARAAIKAVEEGK